MTETALAAAFNRAGYSATESQLYALACEMLTKAKLNFGMCNRILAQAANDMRGNSLPGEGQVMFGSQEVNAQSRQPNEGEEGQKVHDSHRSSALSPSPNDAGGGQAPRDAHAEVASSGVTEHDRTGQIEYDNQTWLARPVVSIPAAKSNLVAVKGFLRSKPGLARGADAMAAVQGIMAKAIVFRLTDGRDIMEAQFCELTQIARDGIKYARKYTREAFVARYLLANVTYANPDPFAKVGDLFPPKTIELAVAEAEKEASHAA